MGAGVRAEVVAEEAVRLTAVPCHAWRTLPRDAALHTCYKPPSMRLLAASIVIAIVLCIPFVIWGDRFMAWFTGDAAIAWIRGWGAWGWLAVIGLLVSDLDRKSTRLNSSHPRLSRMPSSA